MKRTVTPPQPTHAVPTRPLLDTPAPLFVQQQRTYDYPNALESLRSARSRLARGARA